MRIKMRKSALRAAIVAGAVVATAAGVVRTRAQAPAKPDLASQAKAALAQHSGTIIVRGLSEPVEVLRDTWGVPHIYAKSTEDLFFAQGFVVAQDRMWQLEMWRRNGEGRLAEVLGPQYVTRDKFARLLAFRGNWDEEFRKYHPEGRKIFTAFAEGINAAIEKALDEKKVPVEFQVLGFQPQPVWTAQTVLTRMPGWTLSRNASSEVMRALEIKALGVAKVQDLKPTLPEKKLEVPPGLDLNDISPAILDVTKGANDLRWTLKSDQSAALEFDQMKSELGSNNWVVDGTKSTTGGPILANDPHREVVNPALRYVVHLNAPGWNALGGTEPGLPGISIGHNERIAWGFTILGMDQQDLYVEETDPQNPNRYRYKGQWEEMTVERQLIPVKGSATPQEFAAKFTRHGPVLYEATARHRAFALRWVGAEPGGAGYLGSLNVMQAKNWEEFKAGMPKAWYIPSHSLVYADVDGHIGYLGVAQTPVRKGWDGLLPVPGNEGKYEWDGYVPYDQLPQSLDTPKHFYNSSNNDVVPKIVPGYKIPLGYEYGAPYRYDRVAEVLGQNRKFSVEDMEKLQHDVVSLPARRLVPLLKNVKGASGDTKRGVDMLLAWNMSLDRDSATAALYEYWVLKMTPKAYAPRIPAGAEFRQYDIQRVVAWMTAPDAAYGATNAERTAARDKILLAALDEAIVDLKKRMGDDMTKWKWGDIHTADFAHPLATTDALKALFRVEPIRRGGDGYTVMATSSPSAASSTQLSGASFMFVFDVKHWDASQGLSVPGNSAQPGSPHYADLAPYWGEGRYFPLPFSREAVEANTADRLTLQPLREFTATPAEEPRFEAVLPQMFDEGGAQTNCWADFDNDGKPDLFVGFRRGHLNKLYHNEGNGQFVDVAAKVGLADAEDTRAAAWGDFNGDGQMDLYVGFARNAGVPNKLYRNDGDGKHFTEVGHKMGVDLIGETRQISWIDYDNDGRVDLFVAFRDRPNALFHNEGDHFRDVAKEMGVDDPRKTVGAVWFDMDQDGKLDLFVANQDGDNNGFFHNEGNKFVDVAHKLGMDGAGRPSVYGGVGPAVGDFNNDGLLDLYVANYGPNELFKNLGGGKFKDVAPEMGVAGEYHAVSAAWGDYDNDGRPDLYVTAYISGIRNYRDYLYHNDGDHFTDVTPANILKHDGDHGVQWADFDLDGALDLALANNESMGSHYLFHNLLPPARAKQSLQVLVLDEKGHYTKQGSEVRLYVPGTRTLLGTNIVDTGSGYCSQNAMPVHFGLGTHAGPVDVEVTYFTPGGRQVMRVPGVDPAAYHGKYLVVKVGPTARPTPAVSQ
jgi:penicillin amidase